MIVLDTDHFSVHAFGDGAQSEALRARLQAHESEGVLLTVISIEESMRGWLGAVARHRTIVEQMPIYERLARLVQQLCEWNVLLVNQQVADKFDDLRRQRIRIGSPDLKIAAIALVHDALLLTANTRDFRKVPGLRFDN